MERLNLSSRPFTNRRLFWIAIAAVLMICVMAAWSIGQQKALELSEIDRIESSLKVHQLLVAKMKEDEEARKKESDKIFLTEQDMFQLAAARQLITRRSFSWDKMTSDLEANVPKKSKVITIKVSGLQFGPEGPVATLDVAAVGPDAGQLTEMMDNLGKTKGVFTVGDVSQAQANDNGQVPFTLMVQYRPARGGD